jgi:hypothetical protein
MISMLIWIIPSSVWMTHTFVLRRITPHRTLAYACRVQLPQVVSGSPCWAAEVPQGWQHVCGGPCSLHAAASPAVSSMPSPGLIACVSDRRNRCAVRDASRRVWCPRADRGPASRVPSGLVA